VDQFDHRDAVRICRCSDVRILMSSVGFDEKTWLARAKYF
jgi:hypothetical protein